MKRAALVAQVRQVIDNGGRVAILGAPRTGKSSLQELAGRGVLQMCTDPEDLVKEPRDGVQYVPRAHGGWSEASQFVADNFLTKPGPWILEGVGAARALRKWRAARPGSQPPCELMVWLQNKPWIKHKTGQRSMGNGIHTVMKDISNWLAFQLMIVELEKE